MLTNFCAKFFFSSSSTSTVICIPLGNYKIYPQELGKSNNISLKTQKCDEIICKHDPLSSLQEEDSTFCGENVVHTIMKKNEEERMQPERENPPTLTKD